MVKTNRVYKLLGFLLFSLFFYSYYRKPWEWGIMDDSTHLNNLTRFVSEHGLWVGILKNIKFYALKDTFHLGFLRYSSWIYVSIIYLFSPNFGYTLKLLIFLTILFTSGTILRRQIPETKLKNWILVLAVCVVCSIRSLYDGLSIIWLNEMNGIFFMSLGIFFATAQAANLKTEKKCEGLALFLFFIALGFKPPFVWLPMLYSAYLLKRKNNKIGLIGLVVSIILLCVFIYLSQTAYYAKGVYDSGFLRSLNSIFHIAKHLAPVVLVFVFFILFTKPQLSKAKEQSVLGMIFFIAGLFYSAVLLPRGIRDGLGYYLSPSLYLMAMGALLVLLPKVSRNIQVTIFRKGLVIASLVCALFVGSFGTYKGIVRDAAIRGVRDWALKLPSSGLIIGVNSYEAAIRLQDIMKLRSNGLWKNSFIDVSQSSEKTKKKPDYYVVFKEQVQPTVELMQSPILRFYAATIYQTNNRNLSN